MGVSRGGARSSSDEYYCFRLFKLLVGAVAVVAFILVLSVGTLNTTEFTGIDHQNKELVHPEFDLNYMSKRRVPNGPDPIHNRRAGNSRRPPGQA